MHPCIIACLQPAMIHAKTIIVLDIYKPSTRFDREYGPIIRGVEVRTLIQSIPAQVLKTWAGSLIIVLDIYKPAIIIDWYISQSRCISEPKAEYILSQIHHLW